MDTLQAAASAVGFPALRRQATIFAGHHLTGSGPSNGPLGNPVLGSLPGARRPPKIETFCPFAPLIRKRAVHESGIS